MRRWAMRGAPVLVLAAGCFSVPPYEPQTGLTYTETAGGGAVVAGTGTGDGFRTASGGAESGFSIRFADGPGLHFPGALTIDGVDIMAHQPQTEGCFRDDELGILIAPTPRISAHGGAPVTKNVLSTTLRGPAVVQVKLDWGTAFDCSSMHSPGGTSTFTVFPDGRILRSDTFGDPVTSPIAPSLCNCGPLIDNDDMLFRLFSYWTVARDLITKLAVNNALDERALPGREDYVGIDGAGTACADTGPSQVTVAWRDATDTRIRGGNAVISFAREVGGRPSELKGFEFSLGSVLVLARDGCGPAIARAEQVTDLTEIQIDHTGKRPSAINGIYGGDVGEDGQPGIVLTQDSVEIEGAAPAGTAVWLRFPQPVDALRASRSDSLGTGEWYVAQQVDKSSWIVWIRDSLSATQTITISSR